MGGLVDSSGWELVTKKDQTFETWNFQDFPRGPVVKKPHFRCRNVGSVPGWGTKIPYTAWPKKRKKKENSELSASYPLLPGRESSQRLS